MSRGGYLSVICISVKEISRRVCCFQACQRIVSSAVWLEDFTSEKEQAKKM